MLLVRDAEGSGCCRFTCVQTIRLYRSTFGLGVVQVFDFDPERDGLSAARYGELCVSATIPSRSIAHTLSKRPRPFVSKSTYRSEELLRRIILRRCFFPSISGMGRRSSPVQPKNIEAAKTGFFAANTLTFYFGSDSAAQFGQEFVRIAFPRHEAAFTIFDVSEKTKAVQFSTQTTTLSCRTIPGAGKTECSFSRPRCPKATQ